MAKALRFIVCVAVAGIVAAPLLAADPVSAQRQAQAKAMALRAARADAMRKLGERINGLWITSNTKVQDFVADAASADEVIPTLPPARTRELARELGRTIRRMHDWGLRNRDMKRDNVLVQRDGSGFVFLDLDGVRQTRKGPLDWDRRARDLAVLTGSMLDFDRVPTGLRLRALDSYLDGETPPGFEPGEFTLRILRLAQEVRERHLEKQSS